MYSNNNPFSEKAGFGLYEYTDNDMALLDDILSSENKEDIVLTTADALDKLVRDKSSLSILNNKLCYVNLVYDDKSVIVIHTTLNTSILAQYYVSTKDGYFFDVDRYKFIKIDSSCMEITITDFDVYRDDIVIKFLNEFI